LKRFAKIIENVINDRFKGSEESGRSDGNITNPIAKDRFLKLFVAKVNPEIVHEVALTNGIAKTIATEVVSAIEEHYTPERGSAIKARCKLSWNQYQRMMQIACQEFDEDSGKYTARRIGDGHLDIRFPQMTRYASKNKVKDFHAKLHEEFGIEIDMSDKGIPLPETAENDPGEDEPDTSMHVERFRINSHVQVRRRLLALMKEKRVDQRQLLEVC
jgi:hypothetical protein